MSSTLRERSNDMIVRVILLRPRGDGHDVLLSLDKFASLKFNRGTASSHRLGDASG